MAKQMNSTTESIYVRQTERIFGQCILAQRKEYAKAKKIQMIKDLIVLVFAIAMVVCSWIDNDIVLAVMSFLAIIVAVGTKKIEKVVNKRKKYAAAIQQNVDARLYSQVLGTNLSEWGKLPTESEVAEAVEKLGDNPNLKDVEHWYEDYSKLSPRRQVLYCEKENLRWQQDLHRNYVIFCATFVFAIVTVSILILSMQHPSFSDVLCWISWAIPLGDYVYDVISGLLGDMKRMKSISHEWKKTEMELDEMEEDDAKKALIDIQYQIRENRESLYLIPDWFYHWRKNKNEKREKQIAQITNDMDKLEDK